MEQNGPRGWHSRGYLPHFDAGEQPVSITYRLADSIPFALLEKWRAAFSRRSKNPELDLRRRIELYLDQSRDVTWLRDPAVATVVEDTFLIFDGSRYHLHAWVVMPNHVHVLITPRQGHSVGDIVYSWKSYTAHQAVKLLRKPGKFWQADYFDRLIRNERHFAIAQEYIENNPVKARWCAEARRWPFTSARWRTAAGEHTTRPSTHDRQGDSNACTSA